MIEQYVILDTFCATAELIQLSKEENLSRNNKEKVAIYNCLCIRDELTCENYDL